MYQFELSDEHKAMRKLAHDFAEKDILPQAEHLDQKGEFPHEIIRKARKVGLINFNIPEAYGGLGLTVLEECIVSEELAWACSGVSTAMTINNLAAVPIKLAGSEAQKKEWLSRMIEGELGSYAVTEPNAGSDVAGMSCYAEKKGDEYVISGSKTFISNASEAAFFVVFARTNKEDRYKGISCFIIERDRPGFSVSKKFDKLGQRCADTAEISFDNVVIPRENMLGPEGTGFITAMKVFDTSRPTVAASAVGVARRALEEALKYAQERESFGTQIVNHQVIGHMLADIAMNVEAGRLLALQAAWLYDQGKPNSKQAAFAKAFCADMAMKATVDAVQIFGGYGFMKEYPVEKLMRDVKVFQIYEGTSQIQRNIIVRELVKGS